MLQLLIGIFVIAAVASFVLARRAQAAHPADGVMVTLPGGVSIHAYDSGAGTAGEGKAPIVLIHGASGNSGDMKASLYEPLVAAGHRVICFDRPGYGWSDRPGGKWLDPKGQAGLLHAALHELGVEGKPVIVGHSWGGAVALAWALNWGDEIAGVVSLAGATHPFPGGVAFYRKLLGVPVLGHILAYTFFPVLVHLLIDKGIAGTFWPNDLDDPEAYGRETRLRLLLRPSQFLLDAQDVRNLRGFLEEQALRYPHLNVPLLVMTGNRDRVVGPKIHAYPLARKVPGARLVKFKNTGHAPHHVHTSSVVDAILDHAERVRGS